MVPKKETFKMLNNLVSENILLLDILVLIMFYQIPWNINIIKVLTSIKQF